MPHIARDLVEVSTTSTGTGNLTLGAALAGRQSLDAAGFVTGDRMTYRAATEDGEVWEIGVGTLTKSGVTWTLARAVVQSSSAGGAKANFPAGTKHVACVFSAAGGVLVGADFSSAPPSVLGSGIAAGHAASAAVGGIAMGNQAQAAQYAIAFGRLAKAQEQRSIALGDNAEATGWAAVAMAESLAAGGGSFTFPGARAEKSAVVAQGGSDFAYLSWVGRGQSGNGWSDRLKDGLMDEGFQLPGVSGVALLELDVIGYSDTAIYAAKLSAVVRYGSGVVIEGTPTVVVMRNTTGGEASVTISGAGDDEIRIDVSSGELGGFTWVARVAAVVGYNT